MRKFAVVSKDDEVSIKIAKTVQLRLLEKGLIYDDSQPEVVCIIGGDGTFLSAIHKYMSILDQCVFTGIHTGTLGFFVDYTLKEMNECIEDIASKQPQIETKRLLKISLSCGKNYFAVNEAWIESFKTQHINIEINSQPLETFHGSGLVISTQTGSTAYSRSTGGAIIQPGLDVMELCEICGIHHTHYRSLTNPLIINGDATIKLSSQQFSHAKLCFDRYYIDLPTKQEISCSLSDKKVQLAHYKPTDWLTRLKHLF